MKNSNIWQVTNEAIEVQERATKSSATEVDGGKASNVKVRNHVAKKAFEEAIIVAHPCFGVATWVVSDVSFELLGYV